MSEGLFEKYKVQRVDDRDQPGEKHYRCALFVLDLTHDPWARYAAQRYAHWIESENPQLAQDIRNLIVVLERGAADEAPGIV